MMQGGKIVLVFMWQQGNYLGGMHATACTGYCLQDIMFDG
jgi:hypothetical protein